MTDAQLQGLCAQAFNLAKLDLELGRFVWLLASYHEGETLHRMTKVEKIVNEQLGNDWLNSGPAKDAAFDIIRLCVRSAPPNAIVFASVCNVFGPTAKLLALAPEAQQNLMESGHNRHHEAVREGLLTVADALVTVAQTPARVCNQMQKIRPRGVPLGPPEVHWFDQADFNGRLKMYGKPSPQCMDKFWSKKPH